MNASRLFLLGLLSALLLPPVGRAADGSPARILLIAGRPSHGPGEHEFRAGMLLIQGWLNQQPRVVATVASNGWPAGEEAFADVAAVAVFADGGGGHPAIQDHRLALLDRLARRGVGLGFMHYGCEVPAGKPGEAFQNWIGGYYEDRFSCNPMWSPNYLTFPDHPVARGVRPFSILDEWYFNMRFREDGLGVKPILVATPSDEVRDGPYVWPKGPYPHIQAAKGRPEVMLWVREREDGGRGFGFTGGHYHRNWGQPEFRKVVLNALLWIAKVEVPASGVDIAVSEEQLGENLDPKGRRG